MTDQDPAERFGTLPVFFQCFQIVPDLQIFQIPADETVMLPVPDSVILFSISVQQFARLFIGTAFIQAVQFFEGFILPGQFLFCQFIIGMTA